MGAARGENLDWERGGFAVGETAKRV